MAAVQAPENDVAAAGAAFLAAGGSLYDPSAPRDEAKLPELRRAYEAKLAWLEAALGRSAGPYLAGAEPTLPDFMLAPGMLRHAAGACKRARRGARTAAP